MDEISRALPAYCYGDPAKVLENKQLKELGCKGCASHVIVGGRVGCADPRKTNQKGIPHIGINCKFYKEER